MLSLMVILAIDNAAHITGAMQKAGLSQSSMYAALGRLESSAYVHVERRRGFGAPVVFRPTEIGGIVANRIWELERVLRQ